jgi:ASC-1-like (ASCH) protein
MIDDLQYQIALDTRDRVIEERDRYQAEVLSLRSVLEAAEVFYERNPLDNELETLEDAIDSYRKEYPRAR